MEAQYELATAALLGQMTNVAVLTNSVGNAFAYTRYHSLRYVATDPTLMVASVVTWARAYGGRDCRRGLVAGNVARAVLKRSESAIGTVAEMARTLTSVPEGDETMSTIPSSCFCRQWWLITVSVTIGPCYSWEDVRWVSIRVDEP